MSGAAVKSGFFAFQDCREKHSRVGSDVYKRQGIGCHRENGNSTSKSCPSTWLLLASVIRAMQRPSGVGPVSTVARYTDNYILMLSSSKIFSYVGQRMALACISDKLLPHQPAVDAGVQSARKGFLHRTGDRRRELRFRSGHVRVADCRWNAGRAVELIGRAAERGAIYFGGKM